MVFAIRPAFVLSQTRTMKCALKGSVCPLDSASILRSFFCIAALSDSFPSLAKSPEIRSCAFSSFVISRPTGSGSTFTVIV